MNSYVIPICLPDKELLTTRNAIATGYGKTGFIDDVSDVLMKVVIEYFTHDTCDASFEGTGRFSNHQINWNKTVCAGSMNKTGDTCNVSFSFFHKLISLKIYFDLKGAFHKGRPQKKQHF